MCTHAYVPLIGTVSCGTLRSNALIVAFYYELDRLVYNEPDHAPTRRHINGCDNCTLLEIAASRIIEPSPLRDDNVVAQLIGALNTFAPAGTYFGAHPENGADFGFWPHVK